jgi:hypothetical protein
MACLRCQSYQAKVEGHWPGGSSWQTGHFVSAIWKFLLGFALYRRHKLAFFDHGRLAAVALALCLRLVQVGKSASVPSIYR